MIGEEIFAQTIELPRGERGGYLREACRSDEELRKFVEELVAAHESGSGLLDNLREETLNDLSDLSGGDSGRRRRKLMGLESIDVLAVGKILEVKISGKLTRHAYETFAPVVTEQIKKHGKLRILVQIHDFHGWTAGALWEDIKFDFTHWRDIERLVIVGESKWEKGMAIFCKPFTREEPKYFDHADLDAARDWVGVPMMMVFLRGDRARKRLGCLPDWAILRPRKTSISQFRPPRRCGCEPEAF